MEKFEIKENTGSMFKNDYKKDNEKAPDYKGKCNVDGTEKEMAMWVSKTKDGKPYFSVRFSEVWVSDDRDVSPGDGVEDKGDNLPF